MTVQTNISSKKYRQLADQEPGIPLFSQPWWLDCVAPQKWSAVLAYQGEQVVGALPYFLETRMGFRFLIQPPLTQTLGPWVKSSNKSYSNALAYQKDVLQALARGLPDFHVYNQNWHFTQDNWLPFFWEGYEQSTRYTYRLDLTQPSEVIWKGLQNDIRGNIKKSQKRFNVSIESRDDIRDLIPVLKKTFSRQNKAFPLSKEFLVNLDKIASDRDQRLILLAKDLEGNTHAGTYVVWQGDTAYQLLNGYDPQFRQSGAGSLCVWEAIQRSSNHASTYDFEGSMIEPIERFFRAFGAKQTPYFRVTKVNSRILQLGTFLRAFSQIS